MKGEKFKVRQMKSTRKKKLPLKNNPSQKSQSKSKGYWQKSKRNSRKEI